MISLLGSLRLPSSWALRISQLKWYVYSWHRRRIPDLRSGPRPYDCLEDRNSLGFKLSKCWNLERLRNSPVSSSIPMIHCSGLTCKNENIKVFRSFAWHVRLVRPSENFGLLLTNYMSKMSFSRNHSRVAAIWSMVRFSEVRDTFDIARNVLLLSVESWICIGPPLCYWARTKMNWQCQTFC